MKIQILGFTEVIILMSRCIDLNNPFSNVRTESLYVFTAIHNNKIITITDNPMLTIISHMSRSDD